MLPLSLSDCELLSTLADLLDNFPSLAFEATDSNNFVGSRSRGEITGAMVLLYILLSLVERATRYSYLLLVDRRKHEVGGIIRELQH